jgi:hypothetical protein
LFIRRQIWAGVKEKHQPQPITTGVMTIMAGVITIMTETGGHILMVEMVEAGGRMSMTMRKRTGMNLSQRLGNPPRPDGWLGEKRRKN